MKESIYELPSTAVNLSVAAAAKSSLRCKINEIKNSPGPLMGVWRRDTKYIAMALLGKINKVRDTK